ncbi:MAG: hypothetical protein UT50_C0001G0001 [Candidatus Moranbacteria bacterium GW2011_GWA2_39_41]|nr:MAG: hypothetical protein UT50_C0001G0001 [Candidatus Moranbacteria bacterium GW2011_GWA2_39_41]
MNGELMLKLAKKHLGTIIVIGLLVGVLSSFGLIVTQKKFRANSDVLVVQNQQGFSDYYALSKSAEYLTGVLVESIYSEKFLEELEATKIVSVSFLPQNKLDRLKEWSKIVRISKNSNVGILNIEVFGDNQKQVLEISNAVLAVLTTRNSLFLGQGQNVEIRILSGPIFEKNPSLTNIFLAGFGGLIIGILLSLLWIFYEIEFGAYKNISPISSLHNNSLQGLTPEEQTERNAMEYWKNRQ